MEEKVIRLDSLHAEFYVNDVINGLIWMSASALFSGLGNGLDTISPLAHLHIFALLIGFEYFILGFGRSLFGHFCTFASTVFIQALGSTLGFSGAFSINEPSGIRFGLAFAASLVQWFLYTFLALYLHHAFIIKFPRSLLIPLVFPAAHTSVSMIIIGYSVGTFTVLGGAVLDYPPLRYIGAVFGLGGVNFTVVCIGTYAALCFLRYKKIPIQQMAVMSLLVLMLALTCGAFIMQSDWLYQQSVSRHVSETVPVSCVLGQQAHFGSVEMEAIFNITESRARSRDNIILMSEAAIKVETSDQESSILMRASSIAATNGDSSKPYIGVTYMITDDDGDSYTNRLALIGPDGSLLWNYRKAYPNPITEYNVRPGELDLPTTDGVEAIGKIGAAIGFDLDYPLYILQAGLREVDILLQPVWTWQSLGPRHFDTNALRAIENGFTLFRCSSDGVSGIVAGRGPWGSVASSQVITGHDTYKPAIFQLPVRIRNLPKVDGVMNKTFYVIAGFSFDWIILGFCVGVAVFIMLPFREHEYRRIPVLQHIMTAPNGQWAEFSFFFAIDGAYRVGNVPINVNVERDDENDASPYLSDFRGTSSSAAIRIRQPARAGYEMAHSQSPVANGSKKNFNKPRGPSFSAHVRQSSR